MTGKSNVFDRLKIFHEISNSSALLNGGPSFGPLGASFLHEFWL